MAVLEGIKRFFKKIAIKKLITNQRGFSITGETIGAAIALSITIASVEAYQEFYQKAQVQLDIVTAQKMTDILNCSLKLDYTLDSIKVDNVNDDNYMTNYLAIKGALEDEIKVYYEGKVPVPFKEQSFFWAYVRPDHTLKVIAHAEGEAISAEETAKGSISFKLD